VTGSQVTDGLTFGAGYDGAETPWITSQQVSGDTTNLFQLICLSDGDYTNGEIKASIYNVKPASEIAGSDYGTFGVAIRKLSDTDNSPKVLETFNDCNLDPSSTNYVARKIGNRYGVYEDNKVNYSGDYDIKSNYVRVYMNPTVDLGGVSTTLVPFGFAAINVPVSTSVALPAVQYITTTLVDDVVNVKIHKGIDLDQTYESDNYNFLKPTPESAGTGANVAFHLEETDDGTGTSTSASLTSDLTQKQFTIPFLGGFDGKNPSNVYETNALGSLLMGFDLATSTASGSVSYKNAFDTISNKDEISMNLLAAPGVNLDNHTFLYNYANNMCVDRGDTFLVMDAGTQGQSVGDAVAGTQDLDSSYSATYYPWVKIKDANTNRYVWVPPTTVIPGVIAFNDKVGYEWYAPAGLNRGGLTSVIEAKTRLTHLERDDLYTARINPIASFPNVGVVV